MGKNKSSKVKKQNIFNMFLLIYMSAFIISIISSYCYIVSIDKQQKVVETVQHNQDKGDNVLNETDGFYEEQIKKYSDVILSVLISINVALASITATIFIFSKSALDRINDENEYVSDIVNIHKKNNIKQLVWMCLGSIGLIIILIIWHGFITFFTITAMSSVFFLILGLFSLSIAALVHLLMTGLFWNRCICVEKSLQIIINDEFLYLNSMLNNVLPRSKRKMRLALIGDWTCWEDKNEEEYIKVGSDYCKSMTQSQYINQFQKAERLLLSGEAYQGSIVNSNDIITVFQERINILNPNLKVMREDLKNRLYNIRKDGRHFNNKDLLMGFMRTVERRLDFTYYVDTETGRFDIPLKFFEETEILYSILKDYRNLLISQNYTSSIVTDRLKRMKNESVLDSKDYILEQFAEAYYYFFLRILVVFSSAVSIRDYSLNGCSLNYANFYSSFLENITLYSAEFYRTIFARVKLENVIMDISRFFDIDFYCAKIIESSFNNASMENVRFERTYIKTGGFDSCEFISCEFINNNFSDCIFNNSLFKNVIVKASNFSDSQFREVEWYNANIFECNFQKSEIYNWKCGMDFIIKNCDFSKSIWINMIIENWDIQGSIFDNADLTGTYIENASMQSTSFLHCSMNECKIKECDLSRSAMQNASLFLAEVENTNLSTSELTNLMAVKSVLKHCNFRKSNCENADFSEAFIYNSDFYAARLYNCAFTESHIVNCQCQYLLAEHLQFTFANCKNNVFNYSSFAESNITKTVFDSCSFIGGDLTGLNATETIFKNCRLEETDFSVTRFVRAGFCAAVDNTGQFIIKNCDFSSCKFEQVLFDNIKFVNCNFENALFLECKADKYSNSFLSKDNFKDISDSFSDSIKWL